MGFRRSSVRIRPPGPASCPPSSKCHQGVSPTRAARRIKPAVRTAPRGNEGRAAMAILSINPATEELLASFEEFSSHQLDEALDRAAAAFQDWRRISFAERRGLMAKAAGHLREHKAPLEPARTADLSQAYAQPGTGVRGG